MRFVGIGIGHCGQHAMDPAVGDVDTDAVQPRVNDEEHVNDEASADFEPEEEDEDIVDKDDDEDEDEEDNDDDDEDLGHGDL